MRYLQIERSIDNITSLDTLNIPVINSYIHITIQYPQNMKGTIFFLDAGQSPTENLERFHAFCETARPVKYEDMLVKTRKTFNCCATAAMPNHPISSKR
jgi:hypothetical protein